MSPQEVRVSTRSLLVSFSASITNFYSDQLVPQKATKRTKQIVCELGQHMAERPLLLKDTIYQVPCILK